MLQARQGRISRSRVGSAEFQWGLGRARVRLQVIMYDEPTAGLDPVASTVVEDLIRSLHVKKDGTGNGGSAGGISAYIVVTHQHSTIRRSVDK